MDVDGWMNGNEMDGRYDGWWCCTRVGILYKGYSLLWRIQQCVASTLGVVVVVLVLQMLVLLLL